MTRCSNAPLCKLFFSVSLVFLFSAPTILAGNGEIVRVAEPIPGQYIVVLNNDVADVDAAARQLSERAGALTTRTYRTALKGFAISATADAARGIAASPLVKFVQENGLIHAVGSQSGATWGLDRIDQRDLPLDSTYNWTEDGTGVRAYVIDTGIRFTHTDFGGRASSGFDAIDGGSADDCNGHGTHVSGTVGGSTWGVAKNVTLIAVRVLDCGGSGSTDSVVSGVDWVTANHIKPAVANMSLGSVGGDPAVDAAVENSIAAGVSYAVAAGNEGEFWPFGFGDACGNSPSRVPTANTVGSSTSSDTKSSFSNFGVCVDLFAPGSGITSAWHTGDTATNTISGTSMASPHVAGVIALYLDANPTATPAAATLAIEAAASVGKLTNDLRGSPNLLLYSLLSPPQPPPAAPTNLVAVDVSSSQINLSWTDNASNEDGFKIERCRNAGCTDFVQIAQTGPNATSYSDTGLDSCTTYNYQVRAFNGSGNSGYSNSDDATTQTSAAPAAASGLTAVAVSSSQINVSWTDNANNEDKYELWRCVGGGCVDFAKHADLAANSTSYNDTGLSASSSYAYFVRAVNCGGSSDSNTDQDTTAPATPSALNASAVSSTQIDLSWTDNATDEAQSRIERCQGSGCTNFAFLANVPTPQITYSDTGLTAGATYRYRVRAENGNGNSDWSNIAQATTPGPPAAPTNLVSTAGRNGGSAFVDNTWNDNSNNETSFELRRCTGSSCTPTDVVATLGPNTTSHRDTTVSRRTTYRYQVFAINSNGAPGSNITTVTTK